MAIRQLAEMEARHRAPLVAVEVVDWVEMAAMAGMEEPLVAAVAAVVCLETVAMAAPVVGVGGAGHRTARMQMALLEEPVVEAAVTVETMQLRELPGGQMVEVVAVDKVQMAGLAESLGERGEVAVATADARVDMPEVARALEAWVRREALLASAVAWVASVARQEEGAVDLEAPYLSVKEAPCQSSIQLSPQTIRQLPAWEASMVKPLERTSI